MAGGDEVTMVPNSYRSAISSARTAAAPPAQEMKDALDKAHRAFEGGCWLSTTADDFGVALAEHRRSLTRVRDDALAEFDDSLAQQPELVESTDWRVNWHRMAPR
ncbi:hypothetical protein [Ornithinimicrobium pratense]|uniref:Uncharacterized protein n=1 Tax=Ornithinimicrobium pratense TaxID=2593973 RepID=A0A5J6V8X5_9MICO|nr:hypothetical protein [Ornithinimicrobium pratense]QFG69824.1 hypothetical protein FY030_14950 [Ornithinimicrobium pratense]